jgi:hypothetical protein
MAVGEEDKLKLGKGADCVKSSLKRLTQRDETWEADFRMLPKPIGQSVTEYRGMVVTKEGGSLLSDQYAYLLIRSYHHVLVRRVRQWRFTAHRRSGGGTCSCSRERRCWA